MDSNLINKNFNLEKWPIVYLKSHNNTMDIDSFESYKKSYLSLLVKCKRNKEKMTLICDLNNISNIDNLQIKYMVKQAQFNKEIYNFNKLYLNGICILCKNKNFKNILNMYFSVSKPAAPFKLCRDIQKANIFLKEVCNIDIDISNLYKNIEIDNIDQNNDLINNVENFKYDIEQIQNEINDINLVNEKYSDLL
jgi:hypothetical protein